MELADLRQPETIANLRKMGCKKADLERLHFITEFANLQGERIKTDWVPTRNFPWTVSMPFEEIGGGVRRSVTGWGETLSEAIKGAYDNVRNGNTLGTYNMSDNRRWAWNSALQKFVEFDHHA